MRRFTPIVVLLLVSACRTVAPAWSIASVSEDTRRTTTAGEVVGGPGRYGSLAWLGIPFAAPPVGPLRWAPAQPPPPWQGVRPATRFGRACVQPSSQILSNEADEGDVSVDEDCLTLNVWAPPNAKGLPVMVWVHGGGNSLGSAATYDLGHLATAQQVVGVSVQYRLGPLGWLRHAALRTGDAVADSGNFGTLDLIRALEWVRDNAAAFGGDPGNVTIFGESAGGQNVYALLVSPKAKGLFHRAIAQSPTLSRGTVDEAELPADHGVQPGHASSATELILRLLQADGAPSRDDAKAKLAAMDEAAIAAYLRGKPAHAILATYLRAEKTGLKMLDLPMLFPDGVVLPDAPWLEAFAKPGGWNQVPVLLGVNREEAKLFLFLSPQFTWKLFGVLPRMRDEAKYEASAETMSRAWKARSLDAVATALVQSGAQDVYTYRFDWAREPTKLGTDLSKMLGAAHAMEIPFVHGHFDGRLGELLGAANPEERDALSAAMMAYWAEFARTGRPGHAGGPEWVPYDLAEGGPKFMTLDAAPPGLRMGHSVEAPAKIVADLMADPRVPSVLEKCEGLHALVKIGMLAPALLENHCP